MTETVDYSKAKQVLQQLPLMQQKLRAMKPADPTVATTLQEVDQLLDDVTTTLNELGKFFLIVTMSGQARPKS
jgi:hypothetical protein